MSNVIYNSTMIEFQKDLASGFFSSYYEASAIRIDGSTGETLNFKAFAKTIKQGDDEHHLIILENLAGVFPDQSSKRFAGTLP
jgi:hypothetical protein